MKTLVKRTEAWGRLATVSKHAHVAQQLPLAMHIHRSIRHVVVLTGAGVSHESGIPTFRGADGLWEGHRVEDVASPEGFARDPDLVWEFYNQRRRRLLQPDIQPNPAHHALAQFEARWPHDQFLLVTQNIDDLHERAGSQQLVHMHGELFKARCLDTGDVFPWRTDLTRETPHPAIPDRPGRLRPHIVWFGEVPFEMDSILDHLRRCDLFVAIGTSGMVYPAAGFVACTPACCHRVEINLDDTDVAPAFELVIRGPASVAVPKFFEQLLGSELPT